jgi:hypothetical protein
MVGSTDALDSLERSVEASVGQPILTHPCGW